MAAAAPLGRVLVLAVAAESPAPAARDIRTATLVKQGDMFLLADLDGDVPADNLNGYGLYLRDTRFLSAYDLEVQGLRPTILLSESRWHFLGAHLLTNPNLVTPDGEAVPAQTIQIRRYRVARGQRLSESISFQNFNSFPVQMDVSIRLDADFADMFDVRGLVKSDLPRIIQREHTASSVAFKYDGCDWVRRTTRIGFEPPPAELSERQACYRLDLPEHGSARVAIEIELSEEATPGARRQPALRPVAVPPSSRDLAWLEIPATILTSNERFNRSLAQAHADLRALASGDADGAFLAAGVPWFAALFGRDSLVTALSTLWLAPALAKHTLVLLARRQGTRDDPMRDEEPGKIVHEVRRGELADAGLVPYSSYFGTADATPLWIVLLSEYYRTTGDLDLVRELRHNLDAALEWIDRWGDLDGDGFVEYRTRTAAGLLNQGWKDSWDAISHADGSLAEAPIALVEIQAYVFAAKRGAAMLMQALGRTERSVALLDQAERLRVAFERDFWMADQGFYCVALDRDKRQARTITSNPGQALWSGIVAPDRAKRIGERLMVEDLFTGWGLRTLSHREVRYNPVGYHVGTVWPHDNALIALGLKRYALEETALCIASGLFDAAEHFPGFRMPELFSGFARSAFGGAVRYPVACSPQAWAASSWDLLTQVMLGLLPKGALRELWIVRPTLPPWLDWVRVDRLPVGAGEVDLRYERAGNRTVVDLVAMRGDVRVAFSDRWLD